MNGVVATLETAEWSMRKIFDDLAYKQYKNSNWDAMIHSVFRMRTKEPLSKRVASIIQSESAAAKKLLRIDRPVFFEILDKLSAEIPLTSDNLVFIWNEFSMKNEKITEAAPRYILETIHSNIKI